MSDFGASDNVRPSARIEVIALAAFSAYVITESRGGSSDHSMMAALLSIAGLLYT